MTIITHKGKVRNGAVTPMFISKWDTTQAGSANDTVVLPLVSDGGYDFFVDWGDGNRDNITAYNQSEVTHQYSSTGIYEIKIHGGITGWFFINGSHGGNTIDDDKIIEISKWGPLKFVSNDNALFNGCSNLVSTATDSLTLGASNAYNMFQGCPKLGDQGNMNSWDTSACTDMSYMFTECTGFSQPIGDWDTSNVTNMERMIHAYHGGMIFDQDIGNWDVSNVTNFQRFFGAITNNTGPSLFNNGGSTSISGWDTSSVTNMQDMFRGCTEFNQPIGNWNTSKVTNMREMLRGANSFNQDLGGWDMTGVTNLRDFFNANTVFNNGGSTGINNWRPSSCTTMQQMFSEATGFNQPIGDWDTSSVTTMDRMFHAYHGGMTFNQDIGNWDVSNVTSFHKFFGSYTSSSGPYPTFNNGGSSSISGWDTSSVTDMQDMFRGCTGFNQPIGNWDTSKVTNMSYMLREANSFNQDLGGWDMTGVTSLQNFFNGNSVFNNGGSTGINNWRPSSCTRMDQMFSYATGFNQPIGDWDTSSCTNMSYMFHAYHGGMIFDQDIGNWDVSNVTNFQRFFGAFSTSSGPYPTFNNGGSPSISGWDTSSATNIESMFRGCTGFNQSLAGWNVSNVTNATSFMNGCTLSTTNYDSTLGGWSPQSVQNGVSIHFGNSQYSTATGLAYRNALVSAGWTITDGGAV